MIRGKHWIVKRRWYYAFSHRGAHFCFRGVLGEKGEQNTVKHQSPAAKATNSDSCDCTAAKVKERIPEQRTRTEPISEKEFIKSMPKTIGNRKEDCA